MSQRSISQGFSQDFPLLSPQAPLGSQDPPNLLTPKENDSFYNFPLSNPSILYDNEFQSPNPSQTPPRKRSRLNGSLSECSQGLKDQASQGASSLLDPLSQASTISLMGSQDLRLCEKVEDVEEPILTAPEDTLDNIFGEKISLLASQTWGAFVCLQNSNVFKIKGEDKLWAGRSSKANIRMNFPFMSAKHFAIERQKTGVPFKYDYYIEDLKSTNGTYIYQSDSEERLSVKKSTKLKAGDIVIFKTNVEEKLECKNVYYLFVDSTITIGRELKSNFVLYTGCSVPKGKNILLNIGVHRKTFKKYLIKQPDPSFPKEEGLKYFKEEVQRCQLLKKLHCKGVAKMLYFEMGESPYILEEMGQYSNAYTLKQHETRLEEEECRSIFRQVYTSLKELHRQGISHGGISLKAIFIASKDEKNYDVILSSPIDSTCKPEKDLFMLGMACCAALSGIEVPLPSLDQPSEKKRFLDPKDMAIVVKALPDTQRLGHDFIAKLLFAQDSLTASPHPWLNTAPLLKREPTLASLKRINQPTRTLSGSHSTLQKSLEE
ncbi:Checkpoint kinase 2 [Entomophthora muscae]|uniref:Checkpoint kinase 2 n=1 Tax=Entomophthora muscae TaxID=34485 RepID=A0ACC2SS28_9FUNG|nr:Checkpoint kinase 2 [Entomophthora muscae]